MYFVRGRASFGSEESGTSLIETAVCIFLVVVVSFFLFEFCMLVYTYNVLSEAAREGVRYAIVHGVDAGAASCSGPGCTDSSGANITAVVRNYAKSSFHNISAINIAPTWPDNNCAPPSRVNVAVTYAYIPYLNLPFLNNTMTLQAQGRIVY